VVVADDGAETERLGELVLLAAAEDLDALELAVLVEQRRLGAVGVVGLLRPHLERHRRVEERVVFDADLEALVEVLVAVGGEGVGDARVHARAERELALLPNSGASVIWSRYASSMVCVRVWPCAMSM
jgi:hypothetical protein